MVTYSRGQSVAEQMKKINLFHFISKRFRKVALRHCWFSIDLHLKKYKLKHKYKLQYNNDNNYSVLISTKQQMEIEQNLMKNLGNK